MIELQIFLHLVDCLVLVSHVRIEIARQFALDLRVGAITYVLRHRAAKRMD